MFVTHKSLLFTYVMSNDGYFTYLQSGEFYYLDSTRRAITFEWWRRKLFVITSTSILYSWLFAAYNNNFFYNNTQVKMHLNVFIKFNIQFSKVTHLATSKAWPCGVGEVVENSKSPWLCFFFIKESCCFSTANFILSSSCFRFNSNNSFWAICA